MPSSPSGELRRLKFLQGDDGPAALLSEAREARLTDLRKGAELAQTAVQLSRHHENSAVLAESLTFLAQCLLRLADNGPAHTAIREAVELCESLGDDALLSMALNTDGNIRQRLGDFNGAIETHQRCLLLRRSRSDRKGEAGSLNNLGSVHFEIGDLSRSLDYHLQGLQIKAELGDKQDEAVSLGNIGAVYFELGDYPTSLEYQRLSLELHQALGDRAGSAFPLGNLGEIYLKMNDPTAAVDCMQQALALRREFGERADEALEMVILGRAQQALGDIPAAIDTLKASMKLAEQLGYISVQVTALISLGRLMLKDLAPNLRQRAEAWGTRGPISMFEQAVQLALQSGARQRLWEAYLGIAETHKQEGRPAEALAYYEKYQAIKEGILVEEASHQTTRLQLLAGMAAERREQASHLQHGRELSRAHATLRQARKARRDLHQALTTGMRDPLLALQGRVTELLTIAGLPVAAQSVAEAIRTDTTLALTRLQNISRAGLNVSQVHRLNRGPIMLDALMAGITSLHEEQHPASAIKLITEPCPVEVDALLMVEAMDQILDRALTLAAPGAGMRIVVRRETETVAVMLSAAIAAPPPGAAAPEAPDITGMEAAREIIRRHGGDLTTAPGAVGEFTLRVRLPMQEIPPVK